MSVSDPPTSSLHSLFLPLLPGQNAIFCALSSLLGWKPSQDPTAAAHASQSNATESVYSAAEAAAAVTAVRRSQSLFELLSARVEVGVVVLRTSEVLFVNLRDKRHGPAVLRRIHGGVGGAGASLEEAGLGLATCATLFPLEVAYACRIPCKSSRAAAFEYSYPRGGIGGEDGRVSVFSESGFLLSFIAHAGAVVSVHGVYACAGSGHAPPSETTSATSESQEGVGGLEALGFITAGAEGVIYVWCSDRRSKRRRREIGEAIGFPTRHVAYAVNQPCLTDWPLLPSHKTLFASDPTLPQVLLIYPTSPHKVCVQPLNITEPSEPSIPAQLYTLPESTAQPVTAIAVDGEFCVVARGAELFLMTLAPPELVSSGGDTYAKATPTGKLIFSALTAIKSLYLNGDLLTVGCKDGMLFVLELPYGGVIVQCYDYEDQPVKSVTLHARARLMVLVDALEGSVELVRLPAASFKHTCGSLSSRLAPSDAVKQLYAGSAPSARGLQTALALRYRCQVEELSRSKQATQDEAPVQQGTALAVASLSNARCDKSSAASEAVEDFYTKVIKALNETYHILLFSIPEKYMWSLG